MSRIVTFTFRVTADERRMLESLAKNLQRSQSDTVRFLIREAARELPTNIPKQETRKADDVQRCEGLDHANLRASGYEDAAIDTLCPPRHWRNEESRVQYSRRAVLNGDRNEADISSIAQF